MPVMHPNLFTSSEMTDAVNKLPAMPLRFAPLFESKGVRTTTVTLDLQKGRIVLVGDAERGTMPESLAGRGSKRSAKVLSCAHLALADSVRPEDLQDVRAFGSIEPVSAVTVINDKLQELKNNITMTNEFHRLGAIQGVVYDADGTTVLHDIFDTFGVAKKSLTITFPAAETVKNPVLSKILEAKRHAEAAMGGVPFSHLECVVGSAAYDLLTGHALVRRYFEDWLSRQQNFGDNDYRKRGFTYGGVTFFEASDVVGGRTMVEPDKGHLYPVGPGVFKSYYAPADWMETANTVGLEYYARMDEIQRGRGVDIEVQSNPLQVCTFPEALVELAFASA